MRGMVRGVSSFIGAKPSTWPGISNDSTFTSKNCHVSWLLETSTAMSFFAITRSPLL